MSRSQSVLDALADAETLRLVAECLGVAGYRYIGEREGRPASRAEAEIDAHAAFLAIPGLRGEP
mgnify:CR=1 FL=1